MNRPSPEKVSVLASLLALPVAVYLLNVYEDWRCLLVMLASFLLAYVLTPVMIYLSHRLDVLDHPAERKIHREPIPLLGGLGVSLAVVVVMLLTIRVIPVDPAVNGLYRDQVIGILLASILVVMVGVVDDARGLSARVRLLAQMTATTLIICSGVVMSFLPASWGLAGMIGEVLLTMLWVVGITNGMNFLDGMDGVATGVAGVSALTFSIVGLMIGQPYVALCSAALAGACFAFLRYNFSPARIFLGDSGSTFLGFVLAGIAVMGTWHSGLSQDNSPVVALSIPILVLGMIIYDVIYITVYRIRTRKVRSFSDWLNYVGQDHIHHRLHRIGLSERETCLFLCMLTIFMGLSAITLRTDSSIDRILILVMAVMVFVIITVLMELGRKRAMENGKKAEQEERAEGAARTEASHADHAPQPVSPPRERQHPAAEKRPKHTYAPSLDHS